MDLLDPVVQPYAWGSRDVIAEFQGRPTPSAGPEAELWFGAHPAGPAGLRRGGRCTTLDAVIAADPERELGTACLARFGPRLPFLFKILAADQALSIQVHPDRVQAETGFQAETVRGVALDDPARAYVDDWPKPEVISALTPFEALAGFRDADDAAAVLTALEVSDLDPVLTALRSGGPGAALAEVLHWPTAGQPALLAQVVTACTRLATTDGPYQAAARAMLAITRDYPGDLGALASLLMRHLVLQPGEALFMPAGGLHAYLRGVGIELLANSDNVVRAGLTPKHINVPELLQLIDPTVVVPRLDPQPVSPSVEVYDTDVPEFRLYRLTVDSEPVRLPGSGPRLVVCVDGDAELASATDAPVKLSRGSGCFVSAADRAVTVAGPAIVFAATTALTPS